MGKGDEMSKREEIERAFGPIWEAVEKNWQYGVCPSLADYAKALADQAIVIEDARIEHRDISAPITVVTCKGRTLKTKAGHHGTPGKALAIIVPLEND